MSVIAIIGAFWGDEGKGKYSHYASKDAKIVIRSNGGANAGHTIVVNGRKYAMHLLPSSIIRKDVKSIIGPGVVVDLEVLYNEIETIKKAGIRQPNLYISDKARIVLPTDKMMDEYLEKMRYTKVGTTKKGIGPAYAMKAYRLSVTMGELKSKDLENDVSIRNKITCNTLLSQQTDDTAYHNSKVTNMQYLLKYAPEIIPYICNTQELINNALEHDDKIVIEGAQGTYLSINVGEDPFVTSSDATAPGLCSGAVIGPTYVTEVLGVMKAYCSKVGEGTFPTEFSNKTGCKSNKIGNEIRNLGHEYGTTTGRPRRTGWLDLVLAKNAARINGVTSWCINHIDTIGKIGEMYGEIQVCVAYSYDGETITDLPTNIKNCKPIYKVFRGGWDTTGCKNYDDLPKRAKKYISFIEEYTKVPVKYIGIGPADKDVIIKN